MCFRAKNIAILLLLPVFLVFHGCTNHFMLQIFGVFDSDFIPVTDIDSLAAIPLEQQNIPLSQIGKAVPYNATIREIKWTVEASDGTCGVNISGNTITATSAGSIVLKATISNGKGKYNDFIKYCPITIGTVPAIFTGPTDPRWLVYDETTLKKVGSDGTSGSWSLNSHYLQTDNIILPSGTGNFTPIGFGSPTFPFSGSYTVNKYRNSANEKIYYTITGMKMNNPSNSYQGMFAQISGNGKVEGITLIGSEISGDEHIGGIAGTNSGNITWCAVSGIISGVNCVGGITGDNISNGIITACYTAGIVKGENYIGGMAGINFSGDTQITNCYSLSDVEGTGAYYAGGVAGQNNGTIELCYSAGGVKGNEYVGGIAGLSNNTISKCMALNKYIEITTGLNIGRIVGNNSSLYDNCGYEKIPKVGNNASWLASSTGPNGEHITAQELMNLRQASSAIYLAFLSSFWAFPWEYSIGRLPGLIYFGNTVPMPEHLKK